MKLINNIFLAFLTTAAVYYPIIAQTRIVLSAALTDAHFEFRKNQYIESINILAKYGYKNVYIVEALRTPGPTFLNDYSKNVFYSTVNNPNLDHRNLGINEAKTLLEAIYYFNFDPDDIIIKVTGRYQLISDYFLQLVENNPNFDAFVKFHPSGTVYTLAFAMKCKYFKEMLETIDYARMEETFYMIEEQARDYIHRKKKEGAFNVYSVKKLDIKADLFGSSTLSNCGHVINIY